MQITILGSGAAYPRPGGACSGYLVENGSTHVWLDAGNGTYSRLRERLDAHDLSGLVLSHDHPDHISDVLPLMYELSYNGSEPSPHPIVVHAPATVAPKLLGLIGPGSVKLFKEVFEFKPMSEPFTIGALTFTPFRVVHPTETYGLQITDGRRRVVYTADTASFPELVDRCRGVDLLVCEATYVGGVEVEPGVHMWAREAGDLAHSAGVGRLVLTHIWGSFDPRDAVIEASDRFDGPIEAATEGKTYKL
jgi:ribonuclease BN (tRNA processing enzyme)